MKINVPITSVSARTTIIKAWLLAGTLDILSALLYYYIKTGKDPANVLRYVASAVFGKTAFSGGTSMAAAGLLLHYIIALCWTIFFFLICPWIISVLKSTIVTGLVYGIFVWLVMNLAVVPMGASPKAPFNILNAIINTVILMFAVGLPISIIVNRYYREKK